MKKSLMNVVLGFFLPVVLLLMLFSYRFIVGVFGLIIYLAVAGILSRDSIYGLMGNVRYTKGDLPGALKWYGRAYKTRKSGVKREISYGYLLLKSGRTDEAEGIFNELSGKELQESDKNSVRSNLALVLWKKGDLDSAITMLEDIIREYKTGAIYGSLGYFYILKGDLEKALEFNLEAAEYDSINTVILDNLGLNYYLLDQTDKSLETYKKLLSLKPAFPEAYYNYGRLLLKLGRADEALEMLRRARQYKVSFLSTVTKEDIESSIEKLEKELYN